MSDLKKLFIGEVHAAAMAAAGMTLCDFAGRIRCETDYLAISGARLPRPRGGACKGAEGAFEGVLKS